ncbi:MAG: branched-chain amino acid ABC transporter permease [Solirubrobacterales bacterium]|nr:branched-chain amino acid ABC transporter permease [Solirubrobacterales bacterium]MBV9715938.1 branched-chain amino acid ABC transporter permease [Solirubrobacterales bacterium]
MQTIQAIIDAIAVGALYALVAVGLALVFGVMRLINFAQGELITAGAYSLYLTRNLPLVVSIVVCFVVCVALAVAIERVAFRPLRGASPATTLVATFAVAFALEAVWLIAFTPQGKTADLLSALNRTATHGSLHLRWVTITELVAGVVLLGGTVLVLNRTTIGLHMRAAASDFRAARLLGVRADRVIRAAFAMSGFLAAVVSLLLTVQQPLVTPTFGLDVTILALVGAVLGGIDRLATATAGGFLIGFISSILGDELPASLSNFAPSFTFLVVILVLLIRPAGLLAPLGQSGVDRV